jgi:hypothetical protein
MTVERARRILRALGWRQVDLVRALNRIARTSYKSGDSWKWFSGVRDVPLGVEIFLRLSVRIAILERRARRLSDT